MLLSAKTTVKIFWKLKRIKYLQYPRSFSHSYQMVFVKKKMSKTIFFSHLYVIIQSSFVVPTYLYLGNLLIEKKNWIYVYTTCGCFYTCFSLSGQMGLGKKIKTKTENNIKRSLQIRYGSFYLRNMRPLHLWMLCAKYGKEIVKKFTIYANKDACRHTNFD